MTFTASTTASEDQQQPPPPQLPCCISHLFLHTATENPHKIAAIHVARSPPSPSPERKPLNGTALRPIYEGDQCFTFSDVLFAVVSFSSRLRSTLDLLHPSPGSGKPRIVGVYLPPSVEYIVAVLSILRCGEAFLPLDYSWPKERVLSILSSSKAVIVITSKSSFIKGGFHEVNAWDWSSESEGFNVLCFSVEEEVKEKECVSGESVCDRLDILWPCEKLVRRSFCYLMYTSGSTGMPKGVCGTEEGLLNRFLWMQGLFPLYGDEVLLFKTSISFVDHLQEFLSAMLSGCTLVIPCFNELKKYPFSLVDLLQAYLVNRVTAVPSLMRAILPALRCHLQIQSSLRLLVLSGEVFTVSMWHELSKLLPGTSILNLYGSTEVSGDCTYFDCKRMSMILEKEAISSVPIGVPISNCEVVLGGEPDTNNEGEVLVAGLCLSNGYFSEDAIMPFDQIKLHNSSFYSGDSIYYKTGDLARRLGSGDLVFLGRQDRVVKVNGQRVALEEIENTLRRHPDVVDAAVISHESPGELVLLEAFLLLIDMEKSDDFSRSSFRSWMINRLPSAMVPSRLVVLESFPATSSGKLDYGLLATSGSLAKSVQHDSGGSRTGDLLQIIKKAFCDALMVEDVSNDDDFFLMGGNSIAAAHAAYDLGVDMRLLYGFPTPSKLSSALLDGRKVVDSNTEEESVVYSVNSDTHNCPSHMSDKPLLKSLDQKGEELGALPKRYKLDLGNYVSVRYPISNIGFPWSSSMPMSCSFSRSNKFLHEGEHSHNSFHEIMRAEGGSMEKLWSIHMESCVDASPLIVYKDGDIFLFIGSHSHNFICANAKSGRVQWKVTLEGRIECSAAILGDFSQVVVGCYKGKIYFLDFHHGNICWTFVTSGEVKCQPVVDRCNQLIWCGSHDHNLYALDYINHCCLYKLPCGGSVFGSPAINEMDNFLYVGSTSGRVTALSIKTSPFCTLWQRELKAPIFGSLSVSSPNGHVICCLVDGNVFVLDSSGSIIWKNRTGGPVFCAPCTSPVLCGQVLICSRDGCIYSFDVDAGDLLWKYDVEDPITASAYVDEHLQLVFHSSFLSRRLICICTSSGRIHLLCISSSNLGETSQTKSTEVQEFARLELPGDIFSSPVMLGGRIFVGCRDDYVHCIALPFQSSADE